MSGSVKDILSKTHQQVGLLDDEKKKEFAREMSGWKGWKMALMGGLSTSSFRTIIEGKKLIFQQSKNQSH